MNDQLTWAQSVEELKKMCGFNKNFDLAKHFHELHLIKQRKDSVREEFNNASKEQKLAKTILKKPINFLSKAVASLEVTLSEAISTLNINIPAKITEIQAIIDSLNWHEIHITNYPYSLDKMYISRLCGVFYKGTGILPEVIAPKVKGKSPYRGNYYEFLMGAKPLLTEIGIELIDNNDTIGKDAWMIVNGVKEKMLSFVELQKEIEI